MQPELILKNNFCSCAHERFTNVNLLQLNKQPVRPEHISLAFLLRIGEQSHLRIHITERLKKLEVPH